MDRLEAMLSIEYGLIKESCPSCEHTVPSLACESPRCPLLYKLEIVAPTAGVTARAAQIRSEA